MGDDTIRADSVALALKFLADPQVSAAPVSKRVAFLESKGLTAAEIDAALRQTTATADSASPSPPPLPSAPSPQPSPSNSITPYTSDWRDYVIGSIGLMGFGFAAFHLLQNYVLPSLSWPNFGQQKESQERMETQLSAVATALEQATKTIQQQSEKLKDLLDQSVLEQERSAEEVRGIREEIEGLKAILPTMQQKNALDPSLTDLQTELKSLKNLLLNRKSFPPIPTQSSIMPLGYPSNSSTTNSKNNISKNETVSDDEPKNEATPALHDVDSFLGKFTAGKPAIPSWQLQSTAKPAANGTDAKKTSSMDSSSNGGYSVNLSGGSDAEE
ncbi:peroxisomal membrane anchor protein conserved region-domain-containing protein [Chytriomyces cf. hyalinus JEL632]|nr:peroxisomal membrane anchor protein conserved region-domain-containing protein [Chytriomyces cf. hyalinus JEL632]